MSAPQKIPTKTKTTQTPPSQARQDITALLKRSRMKVTVPRLAILETLQAQETAVDVHDLFHALLQKNRETSLSTIYLSLKQLASAGLIDILIGPRRRALYSFGRSQSVTACSCVSCGYSFQLESTNISNVVAQEIEKSGGIFKCLKADILVICPSCAAMNNTD